PVVRPRDDADPDLPPLRGCVDGARRQRATRAGAAGTRTPHQTTRHAHRACGTAKECMMSQTQTVDASISRTPLPLDGTDLATVCVLCSHNCGLRVDVKHGRISAVRADDANPITHGYVCNKAFTIPAYVEHAQRVQFPLRRQA